MQSLVTTKRPMRRVVLIQQNRPRVIKVDFFVRVRLSAEGPNEDFSKMMSTRDAAAGTVLASLKI